jgi:hypothetical protein
MENLDPETTKKTRFYPERLIKKDFWSNSADLKMEYPINPPFIEKAR